MEIKIDIPQNDYIQPTEVREDVVQHLCDLICCRMNGSESGVYEMSIKERIGMPMRLYLFYDGCKVCGHGSTLDEWDRKRKNYEKVRTSEVQAAFEIIQNAGYYIFPFYCTTDGYHTYYFSKRPSLNSRRAERQKFNLFID